MPTAIRRHVTYANILATAAAFLAIGGTALALGAATGGGHVFLGCVNKRTGVLRVVKVASACHGARRRHGRIVNPGETAISWNQRGPTGPAGAQGAAGAPGTQGIKGDTGPSDGFFTKGANGTSLSLPAGSYLITARSYLVDIAASSNTCTLTAGSDSDAVSGNTPSAGNLVLTMMVAHTFASAGSVTISCSGDAGDSERIEAIKVATLH